MATEISRHIPAMASAVAPDAPDGAFPDVAGTTHRMLDVNGLRMHVAEAGEGVPVILCHGFPHLWYSWRHQIPAIAAAGWRAVAPDMRGYGHTQAPMQVAEYGSEQVCGDVVGLIDAYGAERAVLVGLDFGAQLAWETALRFPDRLLAIVVLNNPYTGRARRRPSEAFAALARQHFLHLHYFQQPGPADAELASDPGEFLVRLYWALSGRGMYFEVFRHPSDGRGYLDTLPPAPPLPWSWLTREELAYYAAEFGRTGFTGGLNWYRAMDLRWEQTAQIGSAPVQVPAFFLAGERDVDLAGFSGRDPLQRMRSLVPDLRELVLVGGAGHLVQMEKASDVNAHLLHFLASI
ncbi:MAG TPA: alpha/beta hydrolase [Streptosporangiaceae bacterium]|nr:alpha/beta hydrolase [Streptosporangiaceae bacterium]